MKEEPGSEPQSPAEASTLPPISSGKSFSLLKFQFILNKKQKEKKKAKINSRSNENDKMERFGGKTQFGKHEKRIQKKKKVRTI